MSLSSGMHRKLLAFMVRAKCNFTEVLETAAIYKAAVFEYNSRK